MLWSKSSGLGSFCSLIVLVHKSQPYIVHRIFFVERRATSKSVFLEATIDDNYRRYATYVYICTRIHIHIIYHTYTYTRARAYAYTNSIYIYIWLYIVAYIIQRNTHASVNACKLYGAIGWLHPGISIIRSHYTRARTRSTHTYMYTGYRRRHILSRRCSEFARIIRSVHRSSEVVMTRPAVVNVIWCKSEMLASWSRDTFGTITSRAIQRRFCLFECLVRRRN